jgi:hypothetical protein
MTQYNNPALVAGATPFAAGAVYADPQVLDITDRRTFPAAAALGDQIQIGVVPAGCTLLPHLTRIRIPVLDTGATGKYKLGTAANATAVAAELAATAAQTLFGEDLVQTGVVGSATDDTPIYLTVSVAIATQAAAGKIVCDLAFRAYDVDVDG